MAVEDVVRLRTSYNCECFTIEKVEPDGKTRKALARLGLGFWASSWANCKVCRGSGKKRDIRADILRELWENTFDEKVDRTVENWMVKHAEDITGILSHGKVGRAFVLLDQYRALGERFLELGSATEDLLEDIVVPTDEEDEEDEEMGPEAAQTEGTDAG